MVQDGSHLEMLPPELQTMIMSHVASSQSLYALIRASPGFYCAFLLSKQRILSALIHNMVHPEVLPDAMAAASPSGHEAPWPTREDILALLHAYPNGRENFQLTELIPLSTCIMICRLHRSVEYFSRDFVERCAAFSEQHGFPLGARSVPLSWTEEGRIQRAFYCLQLYGRGFRVVVDDGRWSFILDRGEIFFWNIPAHQIEELACVYYYFHLRLSEVYSQMKDRYVGSVLAEISDDEEPDDEKIKENSDGRRCGKPLWRCERLDRFFSYRHKIWYYNYIGNQISDGLPSLRDFFETGVNEQINVAREFEGCAMESFQLGYSHQPQPVVILEKTEGFSQDDINRPNEAYHWKHDGASWDRYDDVQGLRRCGYVFWDHFRLSSSGMIAEYDLKYPFRLDFQTAANVK